MHLLQSKALPGLTFVTPEFIIPPQLATKLPGLFV
jgi:hypothetical protein